MKCPHIESCEMFALFNLSGTLTVWKTNYCQSDFERCARFKLARAGDVVAQNLLPNGKSLKVLNGSEG